MTASSARLSPIQLLVLVLRVTMEAGIVAGLAYWGVHTGSTPPAKVALGIGAPLVGFGIWGAVDFHQVGRYAEAFRLAEELAISLVAAAAVATAGRVAVGVTLGVLSVSYHALVYATGATLLERQPAARPHVESPDGSTRSERSRER